MSKKEFTVEVLLCTIAYKIFKKGKGMKVWVKQWIIPMGLWCSLAHGNEMEGLKKDCLEIIERFNDGTIYVDDKDLESNKPIIQYFQENSPFKNASICIDERDLSATRDLYLRLIKRVIKATLANEQAADYDRSNSPSILREYAYAHVSGEAINTLRHLMEDVERNNIVGDFIETGVWRGGVTLYMKAFLHAYGNKTRKVWVADSFEGWPPATDDPDSWECNNQNLPWIVVPIETVQNNFRRHGLLDDRVVFLKGWFQDTLPIAPIETIAILRLDGDLYESTKVALEALYPKLSIGGYVIVDDYYHFPGCDRAVNEYRQKHGIEDPLIRQGPTCSGAYWKKSK